MKKGAVLLVEDEVMIRMMVAGMLEELGYTVAAEAGTVTAAMEFAQSTNFDFAILDVHLGGKDVAPLADALAEQDRPFIFATGDLKELPVRHRNRPFVEKPFSIENLAQKINDVRAERGGIVQAPT